MKTATVSPIYVRILLEGAILKGYSPASILKAHGLPLEILNDSKLRISTVAFAKLSHGVALLLRDESYGLLEKALKPGSFALITKACLSSNSIEESLRIWAKGFNLLDVGYQNVSTFEPESGMLSTFCSKAQGVKSEYIIEVTLSFAHRFHCWLANQFLPIEKVELNYPTPAYADEYRYVFYGAPVTFNCKHNAIYFNRRSLDLPCLRNAEDLAVMLENSLVDLLTQPKNSNSIAIRVRLWMENVIRTGEKTAEISKAADHMGLTKQTLRRRLLADGTSFKQLKEDVRRDMAIYYIEQNKESIESIAFRIGFSEASTFIRAFKRWVGLTPLAYRKIQNR